MTPEVPKSKRSSFENMQTKRVFDETKIEVGRKTEVARGSTRIEDGKVTYISWVPVANGGVGVGLGDGEAEGGESVLLVDSSEVAPSADKGSSSEISGSGVPPVVAVDVSLITDGFGSRFSAIVGITCVTTKAEANINKKTRNRL